MKARWLLLGLLLVLLVLPGQGLAAGGSSKDPKVKIKHGEVVVPHVFKGSVANLPAPTSGPAGGKPMREHDVDFGADKAGPAAPPVPKAATSMPAPIASFNGIHGTEAGGFAPPDPTGDVGPSNYVQAVNTAIAIYSKTGTRQAFFSFNTFFGGTGITGTPCDNANEGDPTVLYDTLSNHWIVADFAFASFAPPFYECIAVSKTSDPLGSWFQYAVRTDDVGHPWFADYPKMGVWPDGIFMTANMFDTSDVYQEVRVWAFSRADLESGSPLHQLVADLGSTQDFTLIPSNVRGAAPPSGSPNYLVSESTVSFNYDVWKFHPDYTGGGTTFTGPTTVSQDLYTVAPDTVPEPSPGNALDSLKERLMQQNQYRNILGVESLWVNHTVRAFPTGPVGIQWAQLNVTGGTVAAAPVQQQIYGNVASDNVGRWMGSLAVDKNGDMALGYSASSSSVAPDIRYAGRLSGDPAGTLPQGETSMLSGITRAVQTGNCGPGVCDRWGDYTSMSVDPNDNCTFWYTNQYYTANGLDWQTRIGSFKFASCSATPFNPAAQDSVDFDGDNKTDLGALYRGRSPLDSLWYAPSSSGGSPFQIFFGATTDIPVPGDYNGDGKTDAAIYRPATAPGNGLWYGPGTGIASIVVHMFLGDPGDIPIPGDYDGDGKTDPAIYRPSTGLFFAVLSGGGTKSSTFGAPGDIPVPRDYDGDGKTDFAIYRQNATPDHLSLWYAPLSGPGGGVYQIYFGAPGDKPVPGDYNGDGIAEAVIYRPTTGLWYGPLSNGGGLFQLILGGSAGDVTIPGYYDTDTKMDPAYYRPSTGLWFTVLSGGGTARIDGLGLPTDVPVQKRPTLAGGL